MPKYSNIGLKFITQQTLDFIHQRRNLLLLCQNALRQFLRRQVLQVLRGVGVLDVQVDRDQRAISRRISAHPPRPPSRRARFPPAASHHSISGCKLLELHRAGLGVVLTPFGQGLLVIPDVWSSGRVRVEEQQIGRDAGIRRKDAVGQAHDRVQVEVLAAAAP